MKINVKSIWKARKNTSSIISLTLMVLMVSACTKNFEKYNTNPDALSATQSASIAGSAFGPIEQAIYSNYQRAQNLSADCYSGYMMSGVNFAGGNNNLNYAMVDGWNSTGFNDQYNLIMSPISKLAAAGLKSKSPELWAVALLIQVEAMDRVTDRFGPIAYTKAGSSLTSVPYDNQQTIYQTFFKQIDTASTNLQAYIAANPGKSSLGSNDLIYAGDYTKWLKFANSLRLRLAMRIVKADAATAQQQAVTAMSAPGGLLNAPSDDAAISQAGGRENDLHQISGDWLNINMGASIQSYMTGYNDPRLPVYFSPATDASAVNGKYIGIRIGANVGKTPPNYTEYANLNTTATFQFSTPQLIMTAAEIWFLKAEAAVRGWTGAGTAQTNYETGISTSMQQWGVAAGGYVSDAVSKPTDYNDPGNSVNNATALSTITIKWDPAASNEVQLERIITQKWLAIFPDGQEAWADFRRTGYPRLFTVVNNNSGGAISTQTQIRRLPYPVNEYNTNAAGVNGGVQLLGGQDNGGTRLWWDVDKSNF